MVRASIRLPRRPRTERGEQKRATDAYSPATLARSLEVMVPVTLPRSAMPNCLDAAGQRRHHADSREHQESGTPAHTHDKRAHDRRENGSAKARTRKCDGNGKEHVDLPQLTHKAHASKHRRGSDNGERAQHVAMITKPEATTSQPGKNLRCWDIPLLLKNE